MVFYSPMALSFLIFFPLSLLIFVLCSLFSLRGSWSVVLVIGLCSSPISLLSVTRSLYSICNIASSLPISLLFDHCLRFALPLAVASDSLSHSPLPPIRSLTRPHRFRSMIISLSCLGFWFAGCGFVQGFRFGHILVGLWFGFGWWVCDLVLDGYGLWWTGGGGFADSSDGGGFFLLWFFFLFLLVVVVVWVVGFWWVVGSVVPMVLWERERQRRERKIKNYWKIIKKHYLNEIEKKNRSFDIGCIVKWCVICYKNRFWEGKC